MITTEGPIYLTAEIGINHNGSTELALRMCSMAKLCGFDAVKFQMRTPDLVYSQNELNKLVDSPFGTTRRQLIEGRELSDEGYAQVRDWCLKNDIDFYVSVWDEESVLRAVEFGSKYIKVPSAKNLDHELISDICKTNLDIILSTGMTSRAEVEYLVSDIVNNDAKIACINHCLAVYPCENEDLNLLAIKTLSEQYPDTPIGYSGHEFGNTMTPAIVALGARAIERHVTMDHGLWGSDQAMSLDPKQQREFVWLVRETEKAMGTGRIAINDKELPAMKKLRAPIT